MQNDEKKSTNEEITENLELMNNGQSNASKQLVFDPSTGEFVVARPNQELSPDATTIDQIAKDGFA
jgi:hypothetical protein